MTLSRVRARILSAAICVVALGATTVSRAIDVPWQGVDNANWSVITNWNNTNSGGLPVRDFGEVALINNNTTAVVNTNQSGAAGTAGIVLGTAAADIGRLTIQSGGTLTSQAFFDIESGAVNVGLAGNGTVTVMSGGSFLPQSLIIGRNGGGVGTVNVQNGGSVTVTDALQVGQGGRGTLNLLGGGTITAGRLNSGGNTGATASLLALGDTSGLTATLTSNGPSSLLRTTQVTGPNVNFTSVGPLTLSGQHMLVADIRHASNHSALKSNSSASIAGALKLQFTGVSPALGNAWTLINAASISGKFDTIDATTAPVLGVGQAYQTRKVAGGLGQQLQVAVEQMLTLEVNRQTGAVRIKNTGAAVGAANVNIDGYTILSSNGGLNGAVGVWNSLTDQAVAGWQETTPAATSLNELNTTGTTLIAGGQQRALGAPYTPIYTAFRSESDDVSFQYSTADGVRTGLVEYVGTKIQNNLVITVNPTTGATTLKNDSPFNVSIEGYSILSASGGLKPANGQWNSLSDQGTPNWTEAAPTANALSELATSGSLALAANSTRNLGTLFNPAALHDLTFQFLLNGAPDAVAGVVQYAAAGFTADFDHNGVVNGADLTVWKNNFGPANANANADGDGDSDGNDFLQWQRQLGSGPATAVAANVPEPASWALSILAGALVCRRSRRRNEEADTAMSNERRNGMITTHVGRVARVVAAGLLSLCVTVWTAGSASAADVLLVGGQLDASDIELVTLLKGFGHTVVNEGSYGTAAGRFTAAAPSAAQLVGVDVIVVSRAAVSTEYDDAGEPAAWNSLTTPLILMNSAVVRGGTATLADNRWGWMNATDIPSGAISPTAFDTYPDPNHPFVVGRTTDVFPPGQTFDYINSTAIPGAATMVATLTVAGVPTPGIVDIPAGTTLFTDTQGVATVTGGRRVFFQMYEYPDTTDVFAVSTNGGLILDKIVDILGGVASSRAGDVDGDGDVDLNDFNAIKANFRTTVTSRSLGDLTGDGFVDLADFREWKDNDPLAGVGAGTFVPEPSALVLTVIGAITALLRGRKRAAVALAPAREEGLLPGQQRVRSGHPLVRRWNGAARSSSLGMVACAAICLVAAADVRAYNVAWVSFHNPDGTASAGAAALGFTQAPDIGYTDLLTAAGHNVTRFTTVNDINTNTALLDQLNAATIDLVIVGRSVDSTHYQAAAEATAWNNTINKPTMIMSGYTLRQSRLGFVADETIPDTTGPVKLTAAVPGHAIFSGIALDGANTMVNDYSTPLVVVNNGTVINVEQRGISVNSLATPIDAEGMGGTLLASISSGNTPAGNLVVAEWAAGTTITKDTGAQPLSKHRMAFLSGSREQGTGGSSQMAGILDLTADGQQMFKNAVNYLGSFALRPGDVDLDGDVDMLDFNAIRDNFQKPVTLRSQGDLDSSGRVDFKDFRQWKTAFPFPVDDSILSVPEPTTAGLGLMTLIALGAARRRSRRSA